MIAIAIASSAGSASSASRAAGSPRLSSSSPGAVSTKIATTGSVRKASVSASAAPSSAANQPLIRGGGLEARLAQRVAHRAVEQPVDERCARRRGCSVPFTTAGAVGDARLQAGGKLDRRSARRRVHVRHVDEAGVDGALRELADDALHVRLLRAHVREDRLALRVGRRESTSRV